jgi:hypothetical protein
MCAPAGLSSSAVKIVGQTLLDKPAVAHKLRLIAFFNRLLAGRRSGAWSTGCNLPQRHRVFGNMVVERRVGADVVGEENGEERFARAATTRRVPFSSPSPFLPLIADQESTTSLIVVNQLRIEEVPFSSGPLFSSWIQPCHQVLNERKLTVMKHGKCFRQLDGRLHRMTP